MILGIVHFFYFWLFYCSSSNLGHKRVDNQVVVGGVEGLQGQTVGSHCFPCNMWERRLDDRIVGSMVLQEVQLQGDCNMKVYKQGNMLEDSLQGMGVVLFAQPLWFRGKAGAR